MIKYIFKRLLLLIPIMIGVIILIFSILYFTPGDPARIILGNDATEEEVQELREEMGLNDPYQVRLGRYVKQLVIDHDLGTSYRTGQSVSKDIWQRFQVTAKLAVISVFLSVIFGIGLGILAATHQDTLIDRAAMVFALTGTSIPGFAVGLLLSMLFSVYLQILPPSGWDGSLKYMVLPVLANVFEGCGGVARQARSSMLEVIRQDYIVTCKAKGLSKAAVVFKHELKNALIPMATIAGNMFGHALGGTVIIETVFSIPGLGMYMVSAINQRDYPAVQGCILFMALAFSVVILVVDILYAYIDPRIKARYKASGTRRVRMKRRTAA